MTKINFLLWAALCVGMFVPKPLDKAASGLESRLLFRSGSSVVVRVLEHEHHLTVAESSNHRIVILDENGNIERQVGSIGQHAGELYYPGDLVRDKKGNFYVFEIRNHRVQVFDSSGHSSTTFNVKPQPYGMAVNSKGEILLGQPATGHLITVYSSDGKIVRSFGDLRRASDFYGDRLAPANKKMREAVNRIHIVCDDADNVYVAFLGAPFWRKYSSQGALLFEKRIEFPETQRIIDELSSTLKAKATVKFDEDKAALPYITTGMTIDEVHRLLFSVHWDKSWIVQANLDGQASSAFYLSNSKLMVRNISPGPHETIFALGANIGHYNEVYSIRVPD